MSLIICAHCGVEVEKPTGHVNRAQRNGKPLYCSVACSAAVQHKISIARQRPCKKCGALFIPRPAQLRRGQGLFCSQKCNAHQFPPSAAVRLAELRASGLIQPRLRGPQSPQWKGGRAAAARRSTESGKRAAGTRRYRQLHPDKVREFAQNRTRRKFGRLPRGTIANIGNAQGWRCAICRISIKHAYHVDHVMPLVRGGKHASSNLQLLCKPCNLKKHTKDPIDYMRSLGRLL